MGFNGVSIENAKEKIRLDLVDAILSGMSYPGGRLHNKLRDKGYVYMVHGVNFNGLPDGAFYIYALTNEDSIDNVITLILEEIQNIKTQKVTDIEFEEAIERLSFYFKDQQSSIDSKLLLYSTNELYIL